MKNTKDLTEQNINLNYYSRQIGTYGLETMMNIRKLNVFIYGMRGVGFEVSKNLILAGPKNVTIFDDNISKINDLTSNFYITEEDVKNNKRRDISSYKKLSELNHSVKVKIMEGNSMLTHIRNNLDLNDDEKYNVVVITEFLSKEIIIELDNLCRQNNIGFIYGTELGINGFYFVDFGNSFNVLEIDNNNDKFSISNIYKSNPGRITLINSIDGKLRNNDFIIFKDVEGMSELNGKQFQIKYIDEYNISIQDTSNYSDYIEGGYIQKVKIPLKMNFFPFEKKLEIPYSEEDGYPFQIDFGKSCTNEIIHLGILALYEFMEKKGYLPRLNDKKDSEELYNIANKILIKNENDDIFWIKGLRDEIENFDKFMKKIIIEISLWAKGQISPIASFLGGIISQTILKYKGKFIPTKQWFWFNFSEIVENIDINTERILNGSRYDDQIAIFGNKIQKRLEELKIFIIGAGALGCEFLKSFSLMGIATNKSGNSNITITDNDCIEESNLNRQFLFKNEDIGLSKSEVASKIVMDINKEFKCIPLKLKVEKETESFFNDYFWKNQNFIINAVDNEEARVYINEKCFKYGKILIDSGTNGTKANSQVIIPNITIGYSPSPIIEENIPMCTIRNYPNSINHCIEWALDKFSGYFIDIIDQVKLFVENKDLFYEELSKKGFVDQQIILNKVIRFLKIIINKDYFDCLKIAFEEYNESFNNNIKRILSNYPPNFTNSDGSKFWTGNKRCPIPIEFNLKNDYAYLFIKSYAKILANEMSIPIENNEILIEKKINEFIIEEKKKEKKVKNNIINKNRKNREIFLLNKYSEEEYEEKRNKLMKERQLKTEERLKKKEEIFLKTKEEANSLNITYIKENKKNIFFIKEFEKDNEKNGHIDFIFAASNLRAQNYKIPNETKINIKLISGKIIPAIASTTASIVGLVSLQIYTLCQKYKISSLRDCKFNLANNIFDFSYPIIIHEKKENKDNWKIVINDIIEIWNGILKYIERIKLNRILTIFKFIKFIIISLFYN